MKRFLPLLAVLLLPNAPFLAAAANDLPPLPPVSKELLALQPTPLLPGQDAKVNFGDRTKNATPSTFTSLSGDGRSFRVVVSARGKNSYDVEAGVRTTAPAHKGDVAVARFLARAPVARQESGEGMLGFSFQRGSAPYEKSTNVTVTPGAEWTLYEIPFVVANEFAPGEAVASFFYADLVQTVEVSGLEILDFGTRAKIGQLPATRFTYQGREAGAAWRVAALKRIEGIRTAPLAIHVVDRAGQPLAGARVEAQLVQSEFIFGSEVNDKTIGDDTPDGERYRKITTEFFNTVVIGNGLKWGAWASGSDRQAMALRAMDWIGQQGLRQRGHNLVWPAWKFSPAFLKKLADPAKELPAAITAHITEELRATKGRCIAWDVVNEPVHERDFFEHMPETTMVDWYKLARSLAPDASLFLNEYGMLNDGRSPEMIARVRALLHTLRSAGAPIDAIGFQGHIGQKPRDPEAVLTDLDLIVPEGLPVQITEFDINTIDESLQADYTRDFLIACYSHPVVNGFLMWGFWQGQHWKPDAAMFRTDWSEKPNATVWREWVLNKWRTHLDTATPADGAAAVRGHLGRYRITVTHDGIVNRQDVILTHAGADVTVRFP